MKHWFTLLILLSLLMIIPTHVISQTDAGTAGDAGDSASNAVPVDYNTTYSGEIGVLLDNTAGSEDTTDFYQLEARAEGNLSLYFEMTNPSETDEIAVSILSDDILSGQETFIGSQTFDNDLISQYLVVPILSSQTVYFRVETSSDTITYDFRGDYENGTYSQSDGDQSYDTDQLYKEDYSLNTNVTGYIGNSHVDTYGEVDTDDWYSISIPAEGYLICNYSLSTPLEVDLLVLMFAEDASVVQTERADENGFMSIKAPIPVAATYTKNLDSESWNASYTMICTFEAQSIPSQNDGNSGDDAGETLAQAVDLSLNSTVTGTIGEGLLERNSAARDYTDVYNFTTPDYGNVTLDVNLVSTENTVSVIFFDLLNASDSTEELYIDKYVWTDQLENTTSVLLDQGSDYYIEFRSVYEYNTYELTLTFVDLIPDPPSTTETTSEISSDTTSSDSSTNQDTTTTPTSETTPQESSEQPTNVYFMMAVMGLLITQSFRGYYRRS